jgi:hypothetical protein
MGLCAAQLVLGAAMITACVLVTCVISWPNYGTAGIAASISAAAVCWIGAALAMWASRLRRGTQNALAVTLLAMSLRMGLPLVAVVVVAVQRGPLAEGGFVICILAYYAVALVVETWLSLKLMSSTARAEAR